MKKDNGSITVYSFSPAYATTKARPCQKSPFDIENIPAGTAYVTLSRVKTSEGISSLTKLKPQYFTPVSRINKLL